MKISTRYQIKEKAQKFIEGAVYSEVVILTSGGEILVSVTTKESVENLGLKVGKEVNAIIKASNIMVAID